tara:strand:- start:5998 stop:6291 length:294 start_codon:yes stop_codon:yes gene_type:complete
MIMPENETPDPKRDRLIIELRRAYNAWSLPEETLLEESEGTLTRSRVELQIAAQDLHRSIKVATDDARAKLGAFALAVGRVGRRRHPPRIQDAGKDR